MFAYPQIRQSALSELNVASTEPHYDTASLLPVALTAREDSVDQRADQLPRAEPGDDDSTVAALAVSDGVPDFSGLSLRRAFALASGHRLNLEIVGHGYVVAQRPVPGAAPGIGSVTLRLAPGVTEADGAEALTNKSASASPARPLMPASYHPRRGGKR